MHAANRLTLIFILALVSVSLQTPRQAYAQLSGGSESSFDPETENMEEDDHSIGGEVDESDQGRPADAGSQPAPGTLDAPDGPVPTAPPERAEGGSRYRQRNPESSDVIFDWSKYQNATEVPHPFAEKGLIRIDKNRNYIYRVDESEQKTAAAVRFGFYVPQNLVGDADATFEDNYDQTDTPAVLVDWEWQLWRSPIGKFGATLGGGVYVAQGHGHFSGTVNRDLVPREIFTFAVIPMDFGAVYRMHIWHKQLVVPYATGGGTLFGFTEFRDDDKPPKFGGALGAFYAAGAALNLTYFDNISRIQLDREYGINAMYLTAEYRGVVALSSKFDFSGDMINAGFLMEY